MKHGFSVWDPDGGLSIDSLVRMGPTAELECTGLLSGFQVLVWGKHFPFWFFRLPWLFVEPVNFYCFNISFIHTVQLVLRKGTYWREHQYPLPASLLILSSLLATSFKYFYCFFSIYLCISTSGLMYYYWGRLCWFLLAIVHYAAVSINKSFSIFPSVRISLMQWLSGEWGWAIG